MIRTLRWLAPLLCFVLAAAAPPCFAQEPAAAFKKEEIEQMVAPIALYPDPLVAQILMASTYPLEIVSAARWVKTNANVKDKALEDAMQKETWDPAVKSLTAFPQVLAMMSEKLDLTQKLGDAFLGQQKEVLAAIQRLRAKAQAAGNLKSGKEQTVSTAQEAGTTVIKIEPAQPSVVYVPTYNPTLVYGPWPYAGYPPYAYYPPGYTAAAAVFTFAVGVAIGNALWGDCNWGHGDVNVNVNRYNNFNRTNIQNTNWQHNVEHRKGVQYRDTATQQKFGKVQNAGVASREAYRGRAESGRQDLAGTNRAADRGVGSGDRAVNAGERLDTGDRSAGVADRSAGAGERTGSVGSMQRSGGVQADAFQGMGSGGQTRDFSSRGAQSRAAGAGARGGRR